jgi:hypothetical protein
MAKKAKMPRAKKAAPAKPTAKSKAKAPAVAKPRSSATPAKPGKVTTAKPPKTAPREALDDYIDSAAQTFALPIEPAWRDAIKANLAVTLRMGALVAEFELPDEAEPAPVFEA